MFSARKIRTKWQKDLVYKRNRKMNKLDKFKKKRVTLEEMLSAEIDEQEIIHLVRSGMLSPIKSSGTNGNLKNPLYKKYSIVTEKEEHSYALSEIKSCTRSLRRMVICLKSLKYSRKTGRN